MVLYKKYRWFRDHNLPVRIIICKSRRAGLSTGVESLIFDDTITHPNTNSLIVANERNPAENILKMTTRFWQEMPEYFDVDGSRIQVRPPMPATFNNNPPKDRLILDKPLDSGIYVASAKSLDAYLGYQFQNIHATEASRYADAPELFRAIYPTLSRHEHSALYIESTPAGQEGKGAWFYEQCWDAHERKDTQYGEMALVFIPWHEMRHSFAIPFKEATKREQFIRSYTKTEKELLNRFPHISAEQFQWRRMVLSGPPFNRDEDIFDQEYPCLVFGTKVGTDSGIVPIEDVPIGAVTNTGVVQGRKATGTHECVRVTTKMGYTIDCTLTHPIALEAGGFVAAGDALGERIRLQAPMFAKKPFTHVSRPLPLLETRTPMTEEFARWLGYYMGDGCLYGRGIEIACDSKDEDVVAEVEALTLKIFGRASRSYSGKGTGCTRIRHNSNAAADVLLSLGCAEMREQLARRRVCVPDAIWRSPKSVVREFLAALFEADGWCSKTKNTVRFFAKGEQFSKDVQLLLLGFGVHSMRRRIQKKGTEHVGYELTLWSLDARRFMEEIGFRSARKNGACGTLNKNGRPAVEVGMVDAVATLEPLGPLPVFDIDVAETHVFDANGILVHNTDLATAFLVSGASVFGRKTIKRLMNQTREPIWTGDIFWGESDEHNQFAPPYEAVRRPKFLTRGQAMQDGWKSHTNERTYNNLKVWRWPKKGERLFAACDVGRGLPDSRDGDYSTICVGVLNEFDRDELIMTWKGRLNPVLFGELASALCHALVRMVGDDCVAPELVPEWTGPGISMCTYMDAKHLYPHLYRYETPGVHGMPKSKHVGWESNFKTKPMAVGYTRRMVEADQIDIPDADLVTQMGSYKETGDDEYNGAAGRHDDLVSAFLILCAIMKLRRKTLPGDDTPMQIDLYGGDDGGYYYDEPADNSVEWDAFNSHVRQRAPGLEGASSEGVEEGLFWGD